MFRQDIINTISADHAWLIFRKGWPGFSTFVEILVALDQHKQDMKLMIIRRKRSAFLAARLISGKGGRAYATDETLPARRRQQTITLFVSNVRIAKSLISLHKFSGVIQTRCNPLCSEGSRKMHRIIKEDSPDNSHSSYSLAGLITASPNRMHTMLCH